MPSIQLCRYQLNAIKQTKKGSILCGGVGSGKSRTALAYYYICNGGKIDPKICVEADNPSMDLFDISIEKLSNPKNLYIITTARKRDTLEWESEMAPFLLTQDDELKCYDHIVVVDSWNNIKKYSEVTNSFFIFDEQRVVGSGVWVKSFLKIAKSNHWILLSATPGDTWLDYIPVFVANGFYRNRTEFKRDHVVYSSHSKFPKVERYLNTGKLNRLRNSILVKMDFRRPTEAHHEDVYVPYNLQKYREVGKTRWNPYTNKPIKNIAELCYVWRKIVNTDESRQDALLEIFEEHPKLIVFYNFDYELDILKILDYGDGVSIAEWNGHKHETIPNSTKWVYLVQYTAGAEGWNCTETDTIVFYSQNYSYKIMQQASGRIDRLNTPFHDLYYYHLKARSGIDFGISKALKEKRNFTENGFINSKRNVY